MKNKVIQSYITFSASVLALAGILICYFTPPFSFQALLLNIFYSLFGGAVLTFVLSIFEYNNLKKEIANEFFDEYIAFLKSIHNISFLDITDLELIVSRFAFLGLTDTSQFDFKEELCKKAVEELHEIGIDVKENHVSTFIKLEYDAFNKRLMDTIKSYIAVSEYRLSRIWKLSCSIYYFSPFSNRRHSEHLELSDDAYEAIQIVENRKEALNLYLKHEISNPYQIAKYVQELNEYFYSIKRDGTTTQALESKFYDLLNRLNYFASICMNNQYSEIVPKPFYFSKQSFAKKEDTNFDDE